MVVWRHSLWLKGMMVLSLLAADAAAANADVVFDPAALDLGTIRAGQPARAAAWLVNRGHAAAELLEVQAGCGCLRPTVDAQVLQPGKKLNVPLQVRSLNAPAGRQSWQVKVNYRQRGTIREATLTVSADVVQEIVVQPPSLTVDADGATRHEIMVTDTRPQPLRVTRVETSNKYVQAFLGREEKNARGQRVYRVSLEIAADMPPGRGEYLVFMHTDDAAYPTLTMYLNVVRRVRQRVTALPASVQLIVSETQPAPSRLVTLRDREGAAVEIAGIECTEPAVTCKFAEGAHAVGSIRISVERSKLTGSGVEGIIRVRLKAPAVEVLEIPVICELR